MEKTMDKIVQVAKARGFVYPGSEIYGGLANTWDYGNLGVELKNNVKKAWWQKFIQENPYNVGVDCAILMNPQTWVASGHVGGFSDPLMDCKDCKTRHRADKLIEDNGGDANGWTNEQMMAYIRENGIKCPNCGSTNFTDIRQFNLMFKTFQGVTEDSKNEIYLRPETAQGIFVNFANIQRTSRTVMHRHPALAPVKAAILPLSKKLSEKAGELHDELAKHFIVDFDDAGAIGKRYRRQDEIGTPFCITYDFDTENDGCVTVRERDSMQQVRIPLAEVKSYIEERIFF